MLCTFFCILQFQGLFCPSDGERLGAVCADLPGHIHRQPGGLHDHQVHRQPGGLHDHKVHRQPGGLQDHQVHRQPGGLHDHQVHQKQNFPEEEKNSFLPGM